MSRFIKTTYNCDNAYVQFRFESSLRKYEPKPSKKIKCDGVAANCCIYHQFKKVGQFSPSIHHCSLQFSRGKVNPGCEKTVEKGSPSGLSESYLVSSNKSIKMPKRKALQERSCNNNELQKKIYASLINNQKVQNKQEHSQVQDELFLNDFQPEMEMDRQEVGEGDLDFGKIQISQNLSLKAEVKEQIQTAQEEVLLVAVNHKQVDQLHQKSEVQKLNQPINNQQQEQTQQAKKRDDCYDKIEKQKAVQIFQNAQQPKQITIPQLQVYGQNQSNAKCNIILSSQVFLVQDHKNSQNSILSQKQHSQQNHQRISDSNELIRQRSEEESLISNVVYKQLDEPLGQKCMAFQGGRIYIDSSGQKFYISVRVFNKLRKNCSRLDDLISTLIAQRPYLQSKRSQLKEEFQSYLTNQA